MEPGFLNERDTKLVSLIQDKYETIPRSQRALARCILENPSLVCTCTTLELAAKAGVSNATVVRFASALGFSGYAEMQKVCRQVLLADRYIKAPPVDDASGFPESILSRQTKQLAYSFSRLSQEEFNRLGDAIVNARRLYVAGVRSVHAPAYFLSRMLNLFFRNTTFLSPMGESAYEELYKAGAEDLFICISLSRYTRYSFVLAELAMERGIPSAVITDSPLAPMARFADITLISGSEGLPMISSVLSLTAIVEALLHALAIRPGIGEIIRENLNAYESSLSSKIFTSEP